MRPELWRGRELPPGELELWGQAVFRRGPSVMRREGEEVEESGHKGPEQSS